MDKFIPSIEKSLWQSCTKVLTGINLVSHEYGIVIPNVRITKSKAGNKVKNSKSDEG